MALDAFLLRLKNGENVGFQETMAVIAAHYDYTPTGFRNGVFEAVENPPGVNEGSCRIFAFAALHGLDEQQTLQLFGDYYRRDVLGNPAGDDHRNIRVFMRDGWAGIGFAGQALQAL